MNVLHKINYRKIKSKNKDDKEITGATMLIYKNLRKNYRYLTDTILGKNYYNMAMDVYTCDDMIAKDIEHKYNKLKHTVKMLKNLLIVSWCIIHILLIALIYFIFK